LRKVIPGISILFSGLYAGSVTLWFILQGWLGDSIWWLALLNVFAPYFFLPTLLIILFGLITRRRAVWLSIIPSAFIFIWLYGELFWPAWPVRTTSNEPQLTVMSFNIWGGSRLKETAHVILDNGMPDIVVIQELSPSMARLLLAEVGHIYPYHLFGARRYEWEMGILSRYPLTKLDIRHLGDPEWRIQAAEVAVNHQSLTLYNVHPRSSNILFYLQNGISVAGAVASDFQKRRDLFQRLVDVIADRSGPVIVAGDFNSTDQSEAYKTLRRDLTEAHRAAGWGFGHTFPAYAGRFHSIPLIPRQMRLDMIFYSEEFVALSSDVSSTYGESDHLPVLAKLAWRK
jgi:vancomycin resistance protein VanJ